MISARQSAPSPNPDEGVIDRLDAHLVNWRLHLPENKKVLINSDGQLDEMLFQGNMITEAYFPCTSAPITLADRNNRATIVLHRELSELDSSPTKSVTSCAPHHPVLPGQSYNLHAVKCVGAAQSITKLITLPIPLIKHTHFFTCVVTLASIIHLSCWSLLLPIIQDDDLKQQLKLNTGALKTLWQVWPSAGPAFGQVKGVASEIFRGKKEAVESGYWTQWSQDEVMRGVVEDQNYMEELQLL